MKKSIVLALATMSLMACRNDDGGDNSATTPFVGTWKYSKEIIYDGKTNKVLSTIPVSACLAKSTLQFTKDGKVINKEYIADIKGNCSVLGEDNEIYKYDTSAKILYMGGSEASLLKYSVLKLTDTELEIKSFFGFDANKDGVEDIVADSYTKVN